MYIIVIDLILTYSAGQWNPTPLPLLLHCYTDIKHQPSGHFLISGERYFIQNSKTAFVSVTEILICIWEQKPWSCWETKVDKKDNFSETSRTRINSRTFTHIHTDTNIFSPKILVYKIWSIHWPTWKSIRMMFWHTCEYACVRACMRACVRVVIFFPTFKHKWLYGNSHCYWLGGPIVKPITVLDCWDFQLNFGTN